MLRRLVCITTVWLFGGIAIAAAADATFVLNNGERHSGTLVYGRENSRFGDQRFHLVESGRDRIFEPNEIAVIDFSNGRTTASEQRALPNDQTSLLVMRDGFVQRGQLRDIVDGDILQWTNEDGQRSTYPIRDVSRIYLNPQAARTVFFNASNRDDVVGTTGSQNTIRVNANQQWTDTGITVRRGDRVAFTARGDVLLAPGISAGINGTTAFSSRTYPVPTSAAGSLIGSVNGVVFAIGDMTQAITMPNDGRLMLGVNDDYFGDNSGAFTVVITALPNENNRGFNRRRRE